MQRFFGKFVSLNVIIKKGDILSFAIIIRNTSVERMHTPFIINSFIQHMFGFHTPSVLLGNYLYTDKNLWSCIVSVYHW